MNNTKMIPFEKLSKKEQRRINNAKRNTWSIDPTTRTEPKNKYKEKKYSEKYDY